ncbi:hypothetical protein ABT282_08280 [Streptomyces sp. NPDC000927]
MTLSPGNIPTNLYGENALMCRLDTAARALRAASALLLTDADGKMK